MKGRYFIQILSVILLVVYPAFVWSQDLKIKHLSVVDGLSQNTIWTAIQDRQGFIWLGTQDGLNLYDGYSFKVFKNDPLDTNVLTDSHVWSLYEDDLQNLWIGTLHGLFKYNSRTNQFIFFGFNHARKDFVSVRKILSVKDNTVWVAIDGVGLCLLNADLNTFETYTFESKTETIYKANSVRSALQDHNGNFWIGTETGLKFFDTKQKSYREFLHNPSNPQSLSDNKVEALFEDPQHKIWIGTRQSGLSIYDPKNQSFQHYQEEPHNPFSLSDNFVTAIYRDRGGRMWIGTRNGLNLFDNRAKTFTRYLPIPNNYNTLSDSWITTITEIPGRQLLVGTFGGGINFIDLQTKPFTTVTQSPGGNSLSSKTIWAFYEDEPEQVLIGTQDGLDIYHKKNKTFKHFVNQKGNPTSLSANEVTCIYKDRNERLWIGTHSGGLNLMNNDGKSFTHFKSLPNDTTTLLDNGITSIANDRHGHLWIVSHNGLNLYNEKTRTFKQFPNNPGILSYGMSRNSNSSIFIETSGKIWVGTDGGLTRFNEDSKSFEIFSHDPSNPNSISSNFIYTVYQDHSGRIWIGTQAGLNLFNEKTQNFSVIKKEDGLADNTIYGVLEDDQGRLWMSTNRGLSRFTPGTTLDFDKKQIGSFRNYDVTDGIQNNEFNSGAYAKGISGNLYFGGINGFTFFHPDSIVDDLQPPSIVLTELTIFNKPILPGINYNDFSIPGSINALPELTLTHKQSQFTIEFSALNYINPEKNKFAYKLDGFEPDWNYVDANRRFATYTNLDAGQYTFRVKGSNQDGTWNESGHILKINIIPPWWKSWWFRIFLTLNIFGIAILVSVLRTRSIKDKNNALALAVNKQTIELRKINEELIIRGNEINSRNQELLSQKKELALQNEQLNRLNEEKSNLIGIVAHDLRSPLNHIKGFLNIIKLTDSNLNQTTHENIKHIEASISRQQEMISKILDMEAIEAIKQNVKIQELNLTSIIQSIVALFIIEAQKKKIQIFSTIPKDVTISADDNYTHQIIENLISNALKFSPPGKNIYLHLTDFKDHVIFEIRDEGPGITEADQEKLFNKYQRLTASPTGNETSTGLGLSIVKKFVDAIQGKIWCESKPGSGASFFVRFKK